MIRTATLADAAAIADLAAQLGYPCGLEATVRRLEAILADERHAVLVAEEADGRVTGWIHVLVPPVLVVADAGAEIAGLVVDAQVRSAGLGARLVAEAERWARRWSGGRIRVRTNVTRDGAHRFYERHGFRRVKTQHVYDKPL